jgi:hypothetical protein
LPKERHPPLIIFLDTRAEASTGRPAEFPNDCQLPTAPRVPCVIDCEPPKRAKLRVPADELKLPLPNVELRAKLPGCREENPPDFATEPLLIRPLFLDPPPMRADVARALPREPP